MNIVYRRKIKIEKKKKKVLLCYAVEDIFEDFSTNHTNRAAA